MDGKTLVLFPNDPALTGLLGLIIIITIIISIAVLFFFRLVFIRFRAGFSTDFSQDSSLFFLSYCPLKALRVMEKGEKEDFRKKIGCVYNIIGMVIVII